MSLIRTFALYLQVARSPRSRVRPAVLVAAVSLVGVSWTAAHSLEVFGPWLWSVYGLGTGTAVAGLVEARRVTGIAWPGLPVRLPVRALAVGLVGAGAWLLALGVATAAEIVLDGALPGLAPSLAEELAAAGLGGLWAMAAAGHQLQAAATGRIRGVRGALVGVLYGAMAVAWLLFSRLSVPPVVATGGVGAALLGLSIVNPWPAVATRGSTAPTSAPSETAWRDETAGRKVARHHLRRAWGHAPWWVGLAVAAGVSILAPAPLLVGPLALVMGLAAVVTTAQAPLHGGGLVTPWSWLPARPEAVAAGTWLAGMIAGGLAAVGIVGLGVVTWAGFDPAATLLLAWAMCAAGLAVIVVGRGGPRPKLWMGLRGGGPARGWLALVLVGTLVATYRAGVGSPDLPVAGALLAAALVPLLPRLRRGLGDQTVSVVS